MLSEFRVFHLESSDHGDLQAPPGAIHLGTCLRSIVLCNGSLSLPQSQSLADYQVFEGEDGYRFLLEIVCGLRSKLFGETEILGQFRDLVKREDFHGLESLKKICNALIRDAKIVRTRHLQNLGSHSYGSLIRRRLNPEPQQIHFLGAGQLVEEILPWIQKRPHGIKVFTRNPGKHQDLLKSFPNIELLPLEQAVAHSADVLVIAAPVKSQQAEALFGNSGCHTCFDLRGTSALDPIQSFSSLPLAHLFADIKTNQLKIQQIKIKAMASVSIFAKEKSLAETPRPFGWDDLWAM